MHSQIAKGIIKRIGTEIHFLTKQNKKQNEENSIVFKQGNKLLMFIYF